MYIGSQTPLTVEHILLICIELQLLQEQFYTYGLLRSFRAVQQCCIASNCQFYQRDRNLSKNLHHLFYFIYICHTYTVLQVVCAPRQFKFFSKYFISKNTNKMNVSSTTHSGTNSHIVLMCHSEKRSNLILRFVACVISAGIGSSSGSSSAYAGSFSSGQSAYVGGQTVYSVGAGRTQQGFQDTHPQYGASTGRAQVSLHNQLNIFNYSYWCGSLRGNLSYHRSNMTGSALKH